jgi:hypothetical protein
MIGELGENAVVVKIIMVCTVFFPEFDNRHPDSGWYAISRLSISCCDRKVAPAKNTSSGARLAHK